jgi:hypothetical protein
VVRGRWALRGRGDGGQVVVLSAVVVALVVVGALVVGEVAGVVVDRARARGAADAAALAGVVEGRDEARAVAEGNGGELEGYVEVGGEVEVVVRVGRARATARAAAGEGRGSLGRRPSASVHRPSRGYSSVG